MNNVEQIVVNKALDLVWQNPRKDRNVTVQLSRISPRNGYSDSGRVAWDKIPCPTVEGDYHFYQIGENHPASISLISKKYRWYRLDQWASVAHLNIYLYDKNGVLIPLNHAYVIRLYNENFVIAVLRDEVITDLNDEALYIRFYRNQYYTTPHTAELDTEIDYIGFTKTKRNGPDEIAAFLDQIRRLGTAVSNKLRITKNGRLVDTIVPQEIVDKDTIEVHYDLSIKEHLDIPVSGLRTYRSSLDKKTKYLLHLTKGEHGYDMTYRDDLDIFIYKVDKETKKRTGVYYHRNQEDAVRMITHRDYGLPVPYVMGLIEYIDPHPDLDDFFIRVYIKENNQQKDIIEDVNMVSSLYELPDEKIIEAMTAVDGVVPEWTADKLESSAYTALMRSQRHQITPALALDAMSYSTIAKLLAEPNLKITRNPNGDHFILPAGLTKMVTVFEYNSQGKLLGFYHQEGVGKYYPYNKDCLFVEAYAGLGTDHLNIHRDNTPFQLIPGVAYRFYLATTEGGEVVGDWQDATHDKRILIDGLTCQFNHESIGETSIAIGDDKFLCYDITNELSDGAMDIALRPFLTGNKPIMIPPGKIDLWLNGHALVEDIDYFVDFPYITIVNKRYIDNTRSTQRITVRAMGFPITHEGKLKRNKAREVGFVQYGRVSVNDTFNVHDRKLLRTTVAGGVFHPNVVPFDESKVLDWMKQEWDGLPYSVEVPYISMPGVMGISLYLKQAYDYQLTHRTNAYITHHLGVNHREKDPLPPTIMKHYPLYSPFLSRIIADLRYGRLISPLSKVPVKVVDEIVKRYKKYLTMDPVIRGVDERFIDIHPHCFNSDVELVPRDFAFVERLNKIYLNGKVNIAKYLRVRSGK